MALKTPVPPRPGGVSLSGFELSYPSKVEESVKLTLEGTAPSVTQTSNATLIKFTQDDSNGNPITDSIVERSNSGCQCC